MAKIVLHASLAALYYKGVDFTTRMVSPPVELKDDTVYILPFKDAKKLQNNNLGTIIDLVLPELEVDEEVEPNTNTSLLQITRKPPKPGKPGDTGHTLDDELDGLFKEPELTTVPEKSSLFDDEETDTLFD